MFYTSCVRFCCAGDNSCSVQKLSQRNCTSSAIRMASSMRGMVTATTTHMMMQPFLLRDECDNLAACVEIWTSVVCVCVCVCVCVFVCMCVCVSTHLPRLSVQSQHVLVLHSHSPLQWEGKYIILWRLVHVQYSGLYSAVSYVPMASTTPPCSSTILARSLCIPWRSIMSL